MSFKDRVESWGAYMYLGAAGIGAILVLGVLLSPGNPDAVSIQEKIRRAVEEKKNQDSLETAEQHELALAMPRSSFVSRAFLRTLQGWDGLKYKTAIERSVMRLRRAGWRPELPAAHDYEALLEELQRFGGDVDRMSPILDDESRALSEEKVPDYIIEKWMLWLTNLEYDGWRHGL